VRRRSRQLVVDASIAHGAGSPAATHPTPMRCRAFLQEIEAQRGYAMVWTEAIADEWRRHASPFAIRWRVKMASAQRIADVDGERDDELREAIEVAAAAMNAGGIMQKDTRLVEAALATERTVTSLDDRARGWFARTAGRIRRLAKIVWVNPDVPEESPIDWLRSGAKPERARTLAQYAPAARGEG
jgi:hypothetical protein